MINATVAEKVWLDKLGIGGFKPNKELRITQLSLAETNALRKEAGLDPLTAEQLAANRG